MLKTVCFCWYPTILLIWSWENFVKKFVCSLSHQDIIIQRESQAAFHKMTAASAKIYNTSHYGSYTSAEFFLKNVSSVKIKKSVQQHPSRTRRVLLNVWIVGECNSASMTLLYIFPSTLIHSSHIRVSSLILLSIFIGKEIIVFTINGRGLSMTAKHTTPLLHQKTWPRVVPIFTVWTYFLVFFN